MHSLRGILFKYGVDFRQRTSFRYVIETSVLNYAKTRAALGARVQLAVQDTYPKGYACVSSLLSSLEWYPQVLVFIERFYMKPCPLVRMKFLKPSRR